MRPSCGFAGWWAEAPRRAEGRKGSDLQQPDERLLLERHIVGKLVLRSFVAEPNEPLHILRRNDGPSTSHLTFKEP